MTGLRSADVAAQPFRPARIARGVGNAIKGTPGAAVDLALGRPFRAGKEAPTPELTWRPPTERIAMPNSELKGAPEDVKLRFIESQRISTKMLHEEMGDAVKKENDAKGDEAKTKALEGNDEHQLLMSLHTIDSLGKEPDGAFSQEQQDRLKFISPEGKPIGNPIYIQNENGDSFRVDKIIGKKGEALRCQLVAVNKAADGAFVETKDRREDYVSIGKVLRGQLLAEKDIALTLFEGKEREVFSMYLDGLKGTTTQFEMGDQTAVDDFNKKIKEVAYGRHMLTVEDVGPHPNADEATKKRWVDRIQTLKDKNINLLDYETFHMLLAEELAASVPALRTELARVQDNAKLGVTTPIELQDAGDALKAAMHVQRELRNNPQFLRTYFDGSQTGAISKEASAAVVNAVRNRDLSQFTDQVMPELDEHFDAVRQNKEEYQERVRRVGRNRKIGGAALLAIGAFGYFGANKILKDDE